MAVASVAVDLDGAVMGWNPAAERMFGWREAEVIGRRPPMVAGDAWPTVESVRATARPDESIPDRLARLHRRDGTELAVHVSTSFIRTAAGDVVGTLALVVEPMSQGPVPDLGSARMEAVGRLAGGVAHDFNNILTAIAGYAGLLASELAPDDPRQAYVAEIRKTTDRANRLTRQLLAFGRREAQAPQALDLNDVLADVLPMLRQLIGANIELITQTDLDLWPVCADPVQLEQVLVNLVLNASDAMRAGGRLAVSTANVELDHRFVDEHPGSRPGPYVRLAVEDTGAGMPSRVLAHIFEPYFTTKEPGRGTGLGLSTVYGIVKQSDGYIWAESAPGRGTIMTVYLPRREPLRPARAVPAATGA